MNFGEALVVLKSGGKVARASWNGKGMWIWLCQPVAEWTASDGKVYKRQPYLYMKTAQDYVVPWVASQSDILGEDWEVV